jgi:DNA-nicking Smr family endonuclease
MSDSEEGKDPQERELFRDAVRGVKRLRARKTVSVVPKPQAKARFTRADEQEVLRESLLAPIDELTLATGDEMSFRRSHVPLNVLQKLRRGQYAVDAEIDLHGCNAVQAKEVLREFISDSLDRRMSCVRVIHGKGRRSGPRGPVLKNVVNTWLQRCDPVLAFGSARAVDGGSGAIYVLLRS